LVAAATASFAVAGPFPGALPAPAAKALERRWSTAFDGNPQCKPIVRTTFDDKWMTKAGACADDAKCLSALGSAGGVQHLFVASVSKALSGLRLTVRAIQKDGSSKATFNATGSGAGELGDKFAEFASKLCSAVTGVPIASADGDLDLDLGGPVASAAPAPLGGDLDLDLGPAPTPAAKPAAKPPAKPAATASLDLDLDDSPVGPAPAKPSAVASLDLDLDDTPVPTPTPTAKPKPAAVAAAPKPAAPKPPAVPAAPRPDPTTTAPGFDAPGDLPPLPPEVIAAPQPVGPPPPVGAIVATVVTALSGAGAAAAGNLVFEAVKRRNTTYVPTEFRAAQAEAEQMALITNVAWGVAGAGALASALLWMTSGGAAEPAPSTTAPGAAGD